MTSWKCQLKSLIGCFDYQKELEEMGI
jgi:hypothetical protein